MSEGLLKSLDMSSRSLLRGALRAFAALFSVALLACAMNAHAQVGGGSSDPIPFFVQNLGGGGDELVGPTVTFDPSSSYLPSPPLGQSYQYTLTWDYGDGSADVTVGPTTATLALAPVTYTFPLPPTGTSYDPTTAAGGLYTVTLKITVTVINQNNVASPGPSASTTGLVRSAPANYPPVWSLVNNSSPATGILPYQVNVNCAASYDPDGYIMWGAIDWGDGSADLLPQLPPSMTAISLLHSYTASGSYNITMSLIDNGRMAAGTQLDPTPSANNPSAALATIQALQQRLIDTGVLTDGTGTVDPTTGVTYLNATKYLPILRQEYLQIQVPGNLLVLKGQFALNFSSAVNDSFSATFLMNFPLASISEAQVSVFLGSGSTSLVLRQFTTDTKGNFFNAAQGLKFSVNAKKSQMSFQIGQTSLQQAFQLSNATVKNGYADVPIHIVISGAGGTTALSTTLRFVYNAKAGVSGVGKNPHSVNVGN